MQKITPFLWYNGQVEDALNFYTAIFKNASVQSVSRMGPGGKVMSATVELEGQLLHLFNGGPMFQFNEAISLFISCDNQEEIDYYWNKLCEGGQPSRCGWLKDRFGLSWQVVPASLGSLLHHPDPAKAQRTMQAMLQMGKLIIKDLEDA